MIKEFRDFIMRGNVMDMAVGIIIGAAFTSIVNSLVKDVIMPPIGMLLGGVDFTDLFWMIQAGAPAGPYATLADAQAAGAVTINFGVFINAIVSFLIVGFVMFMVIRGINSMSKEEEAPEAAPDTKECQRCFSTISIKATRCPNCTSEL